MAKSPSKWQMKIIPYRLLFKRPAGTSRGIYTDRKVWYVALTSMEFPDRIGIGECAPLPKLSCDDRPDYEEKLINIKEKLESTGDFPQQSELKDFPSIEFGLDTALKHLENGTTSYAKNQFSRGEVGIPINGLIWMGNKEFMYQQIVKKIESGYRCIKLKIGSIEFEDELSLIKYIRQQFASNDIELRVDANGAFDPKIALECLKRLSDYDLHSIEQPIRAGQWDEMAELIASSPLPIALDEELIGYNTITEKEQLIQCLQPHYIILKPSLHGGVDDWVALSKKYAIGWWATSALESNIGLNAIAQWVSSYPCTTPQGLGTGLLFEKNVELPLYLDKDCLWCGKSKTPSEFLLASLQS